MQPRRLLYVHAPPFDFLLTCKAWTHVANPVFKILIPEILYIESLADYIKIHLHDNTVVTRETISNIEAKLPQKDFVRVHRSFVVSISGIESFTSEYVEIGHKQIPISRSYKKEVLERLEIK